MAPQPPERRIDVGRLPPRELASLRDALTEELQGLAQRATALQQVAAQFGGSGRAIDVLKEQEKGAPVLVPLTSSMHVAGTLTSTNRILVDVGTGYVVEMGADRATDYCRRKVEYVRARLDEVGGVMASRQSAITQIGSVLAARR